MLARIPWIHLSEEHLLTVPKILLWERLLKTKETTYFVKLKEKLKSLGENNPKKFWEIIKGLRNDQNEPNVNPIDFETWDTYFNKLYQPDFSSRAKLEYPVHEVQNIETDAISSILNRTISVDEMRRAIKKLKNGKSAGEDNVMNEVLKTAQPYLELPITKLMNLIPESENTPPRGAGTF